MYGALFEVRVSLFLFELFMEAFFLRNPLLDLAMMQIQLAWIIDPCYEWPEVLRSHLINLSWDSVMFEPAFICSRYDVTAVPTHNTTHCESFARFQRRMRWYGAVVLGNSHLEDNLQHHHDDPNCRKWNCPEECPVQRRYHPWPPTVVVSVLPILDPLAHSFEEIVNCHDGQKQYKNQAYCCKSGY